MHSVLIFNYRGKIATYAIQGPVAKVKDRVANG